jgi:hypothetical protein
MGSVMGCFPPDSFFKTSRGYNSFKTEASAYAKIVHLPMHLRNLSIENVGRGYYTENIHKGTKLTNYQEVNVRGDGDFTKKRAFRGAPVSVFNA